MTNGFFEYIITVLYNIVIYFLKENGMAENLSTLDLIHKAAKEEFLQKGFLKASLRNIVKNAGVMLRVDKEVR